MNETAGQSHDRRRSRHWISVIAVIIALIFLYFYQPFEDYLTNSLPNVHFHNVVFWFASLVGWAGGLFDDAGVTERVQVAAEQLLG